MDFITSDNWISTKVGLPYRNKDVLVLVEWPVTDDYVQLAYFKGLAIYPDGKQKYEWHFTYPDTDDSEIHELVAYWCYLPQVPQEFKDKISERMFNHCSSGKVNKVECGLRFPYVDEDRAAELDKRIKMGRDALDNMHRERKQREQADRVDKTV